MKIVIIGAGNVGTHLGKALQNSGETILQIVSKTMQSAKTLANILQCDYTNQLALVNPTADIYFVCVNDNAIQDVIAQFPIKDKLIVHTSGSVDLSVFNGYAKQYGCVYPLQSFSKFKEIEYQNLQFFIETNSESTREILTSLLHNITPKIQYMTSQQRGILHLCAVLVNNFPNHLCAIADRLLTENNLQFDLLKPLITETYEKIINYSPFESQTGPAVRKDENVLEKHRKLLANHEDILEIYDKITNNIIQTHKTDTK